MNNQFLQALKEVGQFIGRKLDDLRTDTNEQFRKLRDDVRDSQKTVQLDLTTRAIEKLQDSSNININQVVKALEKVSLQEGARLIELTNVITKLKDAVESDNSETTLLRGILGELESMAAVQRKAGEKDDQQLSREMREGLKAVVASIKESRPKEPKPTDMTPVVRAVGELKAAVQDLITVVGKTNSNDGMAQLIATMKALKIEVPKTIKIDGDQFRELRNVGNTGGGMVVATGASALQARTAQVANVAMATANTEYSYTFPANTVGFELRVRDTDVPLLIAYETGKLPTSGDGSAYFTVPAYFVEKTPGIEWSGSTIYVQTGSASQVLEVISYTA